MPGPTCNHIDRLVGDATGPFYGPLAHGFACGAHLAVHNGYPWNSLVGSEPDAASPRAMLSRICSVDQADWERAMQTLLSGRKIGKDGKSSWRCASKHCSNGAGTRSLLRSGSA